jgi:hypothetical protein
VRNTSDREIIAVVAALGFAQHESQKRASCVDRPVGIADVDGAL